MSDRIRTASTATAASTVLADRDAAAGSGRAVTGLAVTDSVLAASEVDHDRNREAFEGSAVERDAFDDRDVTMPNIDVVGAISTASKAMPAIRGLRDQIATLPGSNMTRIDRLPMYTWALLFAQLAHAAAIRPAEPLPAMAARAAKKRELFNSDISALVKRGVIDAKQLDQLRGGVSYRNIALDLQLLVFILRQSWGAIGSRTMITEDELSEAQLLGQELFDAVNGRQRTSAAVIKATSDRSRAFLVFVRTYDEVRRAISYLRWHEGDVDSLVPSLYAGRTGHGKDESGGDKETPAAPVAGQPVAGQAVAGQAVAPVAGQPVMSVVGRPVIPGQPGGSPFIG